MNNANILRIDSFPDDDSYWRVDWIQSLEINSAVRSELIATAYLTKLLNFDPKVSNPLLNSSLDKNTRIKAPLGIGHLHMAPIGSVWKSQCRVEDIGTRLFPVSIDTTDFSLVKFNESIECNRFGKSSQVRLIDPSFYALGLSTFGCIKNSPLVALRRDGNPYSVLIPVIEIIRFYYLFSSDTARALFDGTLISIANENCEIDVNKSVALVTLPWGWSKHDGWLLGRLRYSEKMTQRVDQIYNWLRICNINKEEKLPFSSLFPFDGNSDLVIKGIEIKLTKNLKTILCTEIINCNASFNFDYLSIVKSYRQPQQTANTSASIILWPGHRPKIIPSIKISEEPSNQYLKKSFYLLENRFEFLKGRKAKNSYQDIDNEKVSRSIYDQDKTAYPIGTGAGKSGSSGLRPGNIAIKLSGNSNKQIIEKLPIFIDAIDKLKIKLKHHYGEVAINSVVVTQPRNLKESLVQIKEPWSINECLVANSCLDTHSKSNKWHIVNREDGPHYRGLIILEINIGNSYSYLLELECDHRMPSCSVLSLSTKDLHKIPNDDWFELLYMISINRGWPKKASLENYLSMNFNHTQNLGRAMEDYIISIWQR